MSEKKLPKEQKIEQILDKLSPDAKNAVKALLEKNSAHTSYILYSLEMMKKRTLQENSLADETSAQYEDKYSDKHYSDSGNYSDKNYSDKHYGDTGPYNDNYKDIIASLKSDNGFSDDIDNDQSNNTKFKP